MITRWSSHIYILSRFSDWLLESQIDLSQSVIFFGHASHNVLMFGLVRGFNISSNHKLIHLKLATCLARRIFCILKADPFQVNTKIFASSRHWQNDTFYTCNQQLFQPIGLFWRWLGSLSGANQKYIVSRLQQCATTTAPSPPSPSQQSRPPMLTPSFSHSFKTQSTRYRCRQV